MKKGFGWIPDLPDRRDYMLAARDLRAAGVGAPEASDLRPDMPPIWDQGPLGACCGWAGAAAHWHRQHMQGQPCFDPSTLFIYFNARNLVGNAKYDVGSTIRDTMKALDKWGVCREQSWPYLPAKFRTTPPKARYREAEKHQSLIYRRVDRDLDAIRLCLSDNRPVVFGFTVYDSFVSGAVEANGYMHMPQAGERVLGGHAVVMCGHIDAKEMIICRNSWGPDWGDGGYFYMPYAYIEDANLSDDFWTLDLVE